MQQILLNCGILNKLATIFSSIGRGLFPARSGVATGQELDVSQRQRNRRDLAIAWLRLELHSGHLRTFARSTNGRPRWVPDADLSGIQPIASVPRSAQPSFRCVLPGKHDVHRNASRLGRKHPSFGDARFLQFPYRILFSDDARLQDLHRFATARATPQSVTTGGWRILDGYHRDDK